MKSTPFVKCGKSPNKRFQVLARSSARVIHIAHIADCLAGAESVTVVDVVMGGIGAIDRGGVVTILEDSIGSVIARVPARWRARARPSIG